jgi:dethiobiotin synthetase
MEFFISAIHTDSGKSIASAIFCEALGADYWKPVQSGLPRDTQTVQGLVSNTQSVFHPEQVLLQLPASPHQSAAAEGHEIKLSDFSKPTTQNHLIVEGAGGLMVPLNDRDYILDLVLKLDIPLILVSNYYLGSINHTLLSLELIKKSGIKLAGIVFNRTENAYSKQAILNHTRVPVLLDLGEMVTIDKAEIKRYAAILRPKLEQYYSKG